MRGGIQLTRNVAVSIVKMAALPATALLLHDVFGLGIMLAWVIGIVVSLLPVAITIKRGGNRIVHRPDWATFWRLRKLALAHNSLNLAITIPTKLIPVLVAVVVSPSSNGAFYIVNMMYSFLIMVPASMSTVLFAVASAAPEKVAEKLRFVLRMSLIVGIFGGLVMGLCGHFLLSIFGSSYATLATGPLWLLILSYLPGLPNTVYIAVARVKGRFNQASIFLAVFAALRMGALVVGGKIDGLYGVCYGMLAVVILQSMITTPSVLRAAFGSVTVRAAIDPITTGETLLGSAELVEEEVRLRQEAGVAALIALATRVTPSRHRLNTDALSTDSQTWTTSPARLQRASGQSHHRRLPTVPITRGNPEITDPNWWPDIDEVTFSSRQEMGVAALISIAAQAASF